MTIEAKFYGFPKIRQYRDIIRIVKDRAEFTGLDENEQATFNHDTAKPIITFNGTPKLHGTNASLVYLDGEKPYAQSRTQILTPTSDNHGFCSWAMGIDETTHAMIRRAVDRSNFTVYGEWAGKGIQKGVAIGFVPQFWAIFAIRDLDTEEWLDLSCLNMIKINHERIYSVRQFLPVPLTIEINFNTPHESVRQLKDFTDEVEQQCPVGHFFDIEECTTGEGIVWAAKWNNEVLRFKVKGEKHSSSKVKTLAAVDVEKINSVREFVDMVLTESRLQQGVDYLREQGKEMSRSSTGDYLRWLFNDVISEEADTLKGNGLVAKDMSSELSRRARAWWFEWLENNL